MESKASVDQKDGVFISVIVPVYRDWERLQTCLNALARQSLPRSKFEILVVNNDPADVPPTTFSFPSNCTVVEEEQPGSYAARNSGAAKAVGQVFSFTDADCVPETTWLEEVFKYYADSQGIMSGAVKMYSMADREKLNLCESYDFVFGINQELYANSKTGATANLSVDRNSFSKLNGFRSDLFSGGDIDFCARASAIGLPFYFNRKSRVRHPLRADLGELIVKARRLTGGKIMLNRVKGVIITLAPPLVRLHILLFRKKAPAYVKVKCLAVLFIVKVNQMSEAIRVLLGRENERC